jgi:hypothetical protein
MQFHIQCRSNLVEANGSISKVLPQFKACDYSPAGNEVE